MAKKINDIEYPFYDFEEYDHLFFLTKVGNPVFFLEVINPVVEFSSDEKLYENYHSTMDSIVKILGEGMVLQKTDVISKKNYEPKINGNYLNDSYQKHFEGRIYKTLQTVFSFTFLVEKKFTFSEKNMKSFSDKIDKIIQIFEESNFRPKALTKKQILEFINRQFSLNFKSEAYSFDNFRGFDNYLMSNDRYIKTVKIIDTENVVLPNEISTYKNQKGVSLDKDIPVDFMSFIHEVDDYEHLIYNQIIHIPLQLKLRRALEQKRDRAKSFKDPLNDITFSDIEDVLDDIVQNNQLLVQTAFTIGICTSSEADLHRTFNKIESDLFMQGVSISKNSFNQMELFETTITGNSNLMGDADLFLTTSDVALCFFFKESYKLDEDCIVKHHYTNRQGVPVAIDPVEMPMKDGRISNRNGLVVGGSGTGKSFNMNNKLEQEYHTGNDIVIIDVGHSYSNLCEYFGGRYITHSEDKPITMNPFKFSKDEYNIEKLDFLISLISQIYNNSNNDISNFEVNIIRECLIGYYDSFFNAENRNVDAMQEDELEDFINSFEEFDKSEYWDKARNVYDQTNSEDSYYRILGVTTSATMEEIKSSYRELIKVHHPDRTDNQSDKAIKIIEAYSVLSNKHSKKTYDDVSQEVVLYSRDENKGYDFLELQRIYQSLIKYKARELASALSVNELTFNSFYEYAEVRIPQILRVRDRAKGDNERYFSATVFFTNLSPFYRGGMFDRILNEDVDNTLFNERFIVFEIDNIQDNKQLFPVVILIIMDLFTQKMRLRSCRKTLVIEEAWKAVTNNQMAEYIKYLFKTVRKFYGAVWVVSQEIDDLISSAVVRDAIVNNADTTILMDQSRYAGKFDTIAEVLGIDEVDVRKIFTINQLDNKDNRAYFKEFYMKIGTRGEVYGVEVSSQQYMVYTTEFPEKKIIEVFKNGVGGNLEKALDEIVAIQNTLDTDIKTTLSVLHAFMEYLSPEQISYLKVLFDDKKRNTVPFILSNKEQGKNINQILNIAI